MYSLSGFYTTTTSSSSCELVNPPRQHRRDQTSFLQKPCVPRLFDVVVVASEGPPLVAEALVVVVVSASEDRCLLLSL